MAVYKCFTNFKTIASAQKPIGSIKLLNRLLSSSKDPPLNHNKVSYKPPENDIPNERKSLLSVFYTDYNLALNMSTILNSIDLSPKGMKKMLEERQEDILARSQQYIPLRAETLGSDLAAAHFVVFRGGKVKFCGQEEWIQLDEKTNDSSLPKFYDESFKIKALDCSQMTLTHQGLLNMSNLNHLQSLNLENCPRIDDWCLDRVAGQYFSSLEHLNIKNCSKITEKGISCLSKMSKLKVLEIGGHESAQNLELVCLMLEDVLPNLAIKGISYSL